MKKKIGSIFLGVILEMLRSRWSYLATSWVLTYKNNEMDYLRSQFLWKCMMMPQVVELDDVIKQNYEHTNPGFRLREIGKSQLVEKLHEICKLSSQKCKEQNLKRTSDKFSKDVVSIPIHTIDLFPSHVS
jgi:hypothetical protein